jgi:hypothetical protein
VQAAVAVVGDVSIVLTAGGDTEVVIAGEGVTEGVVDAAATAAVKDAGAGASSIPDSTIIARGGQTPMPPAGEVFSGSQGQTVEEAGQGVVHGSFRFTTAGDIRTAGGMVEPAPEFNERVGQFNYQHVDVCLGEGTCQWSDVIPNVAKSLRFGGKDYPFYGGYMGWRP